MAKILVKFDCNYADEFDMYGYKIMTTEQWEALKAKAKAFWEENPGYEVESYFGTNEAFTWESYAEWLGAYEVQEVSEADLEVLTKILGNSFGEFAVPYFHNDDEEDEEDFEDEDEEE